MFYELTPNGLILRIRVTPNASKCGISGTFTDNNNNVYLKINITAVPEKGKANQELIKYLSKLLNISKSNFSLINGETDRYKKILITNSDENILNTLIELEQTTCRQN